MGVSIHIDLNGLDRDLREAGDGLGKEIRQVTSKGALSIKNDWRDRWSGFTHLKHLSRAIDYDLRTTGLITRAEIGPNKDKTRLQGPLGTIAEFGTPRTAPTPGGQMALDAETGRFEKALADAVERMLR